MGEVFEKKRKLFGTFCITFFFILVKFESTVNRSGIDRISIISTIFFQLIRFFVNIAYKFEEFFYCIPKTQKIIN